MPVSAAVAVALAAALDALVAEPPARVHPVALLGRVVAHVDRGGDVETAASGWAYPRIVGLLVALALPLGFAFVAAVLVWIASEAHPWLGAVLAAGVLFSTTSLRLLLDSARRVIEESDADLDAARDDLLALAGRDADSLDAAHVRSAAVESLAENLADGLVAPLFAFAVAAVAAGVLVTHVSTGAAGGTATVLPLVAGAGAAAWVKAVNTLDSMLGYRSKPIGWASARLDDLVMWLPARFSAALLSVVAGAPTVALRGDVRTLARRPSSPNSGWPMATMAVVLPARLHKPGAYDLDPSERGEYAETAAGDAAPLSDIAPLSDSAPLLDAAPLSDAPALPDVASAARAVRLTRRAGALAFGLAGVLAWF